MNTITCQELFELSRERPVDVIDVRDPEIYAAGHATIARNVPYQSLVPSAVMAERSAPADNPIYFICQVGVKSQYACAKFASAGHLNAVNVEGGTDAWRAAGLPIESGAVRSDNARLSMDQQIRIIHGCVILISMALGYWINSWWYLLAVSMGAGLIVTGLIDRCGTRAFLRRMPWNRE